MTIIVEPQRTQNCSEMVKRRPMRRTECVFNAFFPFSAQRPPPKEPHLENRGSPNLWLLISSTPHGPASERSIEPGNGNRSYVFYFFFPKLISSLPGSTFIRVFIDSLFFVTEQSSFMKEVSGIRMNFYRSLRAEEGSKKVSSNDTPF